MILIGCQNRIYEQKNFSYNYILALISFFNSCFYFHCHFQCFNMIKFTSLHKYISVNCIHKEVNIAINKGHNSLDIIEIQNKKLEHLKYRHLKWYYPKAVKFFHYKIHLAGCITCPIVSTFPTKKPVLKKANVQNPFG